MRIEELLLKNIPKSRYIDICNFVEELYLMEYDILILMARKFFNLFCVFHYINCQKYKCLGIPYQHERKIITNRAIPLIADDLKNNRLKSIVVADDIIIHGRSIREIYDELIRLNPEADVLLTSYVRNDEDTTAYQDIKEKISTRYLMKMNEWRELSDEIVNIFYLTGRPYISYLPYFTVDMGWEELKEKLDDAAVFSITNSDMQRHKTDAFMYAGKELELFQQLEYCKVCAIRFYYYSEMDEIIAIPYFCMEAVDGKALNKISDYVRKNYLKREYLELTKRNAGADEMRPMELEYALSAWMSMYFFDLLSIKVREWHKDIEDYNFFEQILAEEMLHEQEVIEIISRIGENVKENCVVQSVLNDEIKILIGRFKDLKTSYKENYSKWRKTAPWQKLSYEQRFVDNYLTINGRLDEERCKAKEKKIENKRLYGIPVTYMLEDMTEYLYELYEKKQSKDVYLKRAFAAILRSIDSGRGTIIPKVVESGSKSMYSESVIYAGEQNYKFYDNTNFPIMYGLYLIEQKSRRGDTSVRLADRKSKLVNSFVEYLDRERVFYIKEEMLQISQENISDGYGKFLQNSYKKYAKDPLLDQAVTMAIDICNN